MQVGATWGTTSVATSHAYKAVDEEIDEVDDALDSRPTDGGDGNGKARIWFWSVPGRRPMHEVVKFRVF